MAIDMPGMQTGASDVRTQTPPVVTEGLLSGQVAQEIRQLLKTDVTATDMLAYLSQQATRLADLQSPPSIKAMSADIPPPPEDSPLWNESDPSMQVSDVELQALDEFTQQMAGIASEGGDANDAWLNGADSILDKLKEQYGDPQMAIGDGEMTGGIWDWMMTGEVSREAAEVDDRWRTLIQSLLADPKASAVDVLMAMGQYLTEKNGKGLTEAFKLFHNKEVAYQENMAELGLGEKALNPTEMMQAQEEMRQFGMDSQMGMQVIQQFRQDIDRTQNYVKSSATAVHQTLRAMIQNYALR